MRHHAVTTPLDDMVYVSIVHLCVLASRIVWHPFEYNAYWALAIPLLTVTVLAIARVQQFTLFQIRFGVDEGIVKRTLGNTNTILRNVVVIAQFTTGYCASGGSPLINTESINGVVTRLAQWLIRNGLVHFWGILYTRITGLRRARRRQAS